MRRSGETCRLSLSPFPSENKVRLIVRILDDAKSASPVAGHDLAFLQVLQALPDGLVIAGPDLVVVEANKAFAEMAGLAGARQAAGRRLVEFLGRSSTELNVLISSLTNHGSVRNFSTILKTRFGAEERVEVSAVVATAGDTDLYGLSIRNVARRLETGPRIGKELPSSVDQLTGLVGKVTLKEIVRESTDLIERLCIEAALEITGDNRASAAEMLGLSRQGLYSKLNRFGFDD
jgi:transcriptional regulator PpsR